MDYTKFVLKSSEELEALIADKDNLFIVACNKCFKEFDTVEEPDCDEFKKIAEAQGKTVKGTVKVDFLCNRFQTARKFQELIPEGTENIIVISCGCGVQTIADLANGCVDPVIEEIGCGKIAQPVPGMQNIPVYAAANSLNYIGHHGMALTQKTCGACAQCYLNVTGGICPIVDCSKSLINGQCGGAKNGKCEIDPKKDCAWEKIYQRLEKQGRTAEFINQPVQLRDYYKVNHKVIAEYVAAARDNRFAGYYGGVHPAEKKEFAEHITLKEFPAPEEVVIPMSQHVGAPAVPCVEVGAEVKVGTKIAEAPSFVSAPLHASISGTVTAIEPRMTSNRGEQTCVVIKNDFKNTLDESVKPNKSLEELTPDEIIEITKEAGITGMGGAGFPAFIKLKPNKPIDAVLLNGCECEPILNADHRVLLEFADEVIYGLKAIMKAVSAPKGYIVIEDNKPDAVAFVKEKIEGMEGIEVFTARTKYPQGAEKMLIKNVMKRQVPSGALPADVGCVVSNVSTAKAISDAIQTGMPLIERVVSVTGERMKNPGNYIVKLGTNVQDLIDYCGGTTGTDVTIKMGGPMMGALLTDTEVPIIKGSNGIIAIETDHTVEQPCIKCGRCVDVCPMELAPLNFAKYVDLGDAQALLDNGIRDCFQCKCCEYICSSKIPLVSKINTGKRMIMELNK